MVVSVSSECTPHSGPNAGPDRSHGKPTDVRRRNLPGIAHRHTVALPATEPGIPAISFDISVQTGILE